MGPAVKAILITVVGGVLTWWLTEGLRNPTPTPVHIQIDRPASTTPVVTTPGAATPVAPTSITTTPVSTRPANPPITDNAVERVSPPERDLAVDRQLTVVLRANRSLVGNVVVTFFVDGRRVGVLNFGASEPKSLEFSAPHGRSQLQWAFVAYDQQMTGSESITIEGPSRFNVDVNAYAGTGFSEVRLKPIETVGDSF
jgi:hypothetical protein